VERAEFARPSGLHRILNSPRLLDGLLRLKAMPRLRFAGQITGVEGYVESAAIGLLGGRFAAAVRLSYEPRPSTGGADAASLFRRGSRETRANQIPQSKRYAGGDHKASCMRLTHCDLPLLINILDQQCQRGVSCEPKSRFYLFLQLRTRIVVTRARPP
jgi:Glucose inhibited division protein A